jgi:3-hydroxyacyl-CoA dehydrogenase
MTTGEKMIRLMDLISQEETDDETIDRILEAVENIVFKRRPAERD